MEELKMDLIYFPEPLHTHNAHARMPMGILCHVAIINYNSSPLHVGDRKVSAADALYNPTLC